MTQLVFKAIIGDIARDLGISEMFCYLIIIIIILTIAFAVISWIIGGKRRKKEIQELNKKVCPGCGGDNEPDALLCKYCEEML